MLQTVKLFFFLSEKADFIPFDCCDQRNDIKEKIWIFNEWA